MPGHAHRRRTSHPRDEARKRVEERLGQLLSQFGHQADDMEHEWSGDTLRFRGKAKGLKVEGTLEVTDAAIVIDGKLPLITRPFESRIREAVTKEAEQMFRA
jgi:hypothetical protein